MKFHVLMMTTWLLPAAALATDLSAYKEEPVPGGALLVAAYAVMWLLIAGFVARLLLRQAKLDAELKNLEQRLDQPQVSK